MKNPNPTIAQLLTLSEEEYENKIFGLWFRYCRSNSYSIDAASADRDLQSLIANAPLNHWFIQELGKIEAKFIEDYGCFVGKINPTDLMKVYNDELTQLFKLHSLPLIQAARKSKITPQMN